jgi:hypothetical protein
MKDESEKRRLASIGGYRPPDADRLLQALSDAHIEFEIECDDGIHSDSISKFGHFGQDAKIRVFVDPAKIADVTKIQGQLFGE